MVCRHLKRGFDSGESRREATVIVLLINTVGSSFFGRSESKVQRRVRERTLRSFCQVHFSVLRPGSMAQKLITRKRDI